MENKDAAGGLAIFESPGMGKPSQPRRIQVDVDEAGSVRLRVYGPGKSTLYIMDPYDAGVLAMRIEAAASEGMEARFKPPLRRRAENSHGKEASFQVALGDRGQGHH